MKKALLSIVTTTIITIWAGTGYCQNASDYLVCQDIGGFKKYGCACGTGAGILVPADHFGEDHNDISCTVIYHSMAHRMGIDAEATQHAGSDSDKWLLHEVESGYRDSDKLEETLDTNVQIRTLSGNNIYFVGIYGGKSYTWVSSNNIVTKISCSSCPNTKPEPLEIVQAYLQKFPSTITLTDAEAKSRAHSEQWLKDEMDRRLWLCDKWFAQYQLGKVEQGKVLEEAVDHMNVFLDYREKYYGISAKDEKIALDNYLQQKDEASIKNKLTEYKAWWSANKAGTINLP